MVAVTTRGAAARASLVEAAERLIAQRGIEGVSLRDVCTAAGQRNHSAAQYHFGDRNGLVEAVYETNMAAVDKRRQELLDATDAEDLRGLVAVLVVPLVEHVNNSSGWYARFLARLRWEPAALDAAGKVKISSAGNAAMKLLAAAMPAMPSAIRVHRLEQLLTMGIGTLAGWEGAGDAGTPRISSQQLAHDLVTTGTAILTAPYTGEKK